MNKIGFLASLAVTDIERYVSLTTGRLDGQTSEQIVDGMPWRQLSAGEAWDRLLRTNRLVQRLCPRQAFLTKL